MKGEWVCSAHCSSGQKVGEGVTQTQEAAFCPRLLINLRSGQIPTERAQNLSWEATSSRQWRGKLASGVETGAGERRPRRGIVCEYLLDYNAVGYYIILQRALNKVIMGEVIFVIKLAVTLGHKSQVLVLKKITKHASVTTYCPPFKYFDFTTNPPLTEMGEIHTMSKWFLPSPAAALPASGPPGMISWGVMLFMACFLYQKGKQHPEWPRSICIIASLANWFIPWQGLRHGLLAGHSLPAADPVDQGA